MNKVYVQPLCECVPLYTAQTFLTGSFVDVDTGVPIYTDESQYPKDALVKEQPFEFSWE